MAIKINRFKSTHAQALKQFNWKRWIFSICVAVNSQWLLANPAEQQAHHLSTIIEGTNLNTADYIWHLQLRPDIKTKTIAVTLLNPHPELTVLNQRAIAIAQATALNSLPEQYTEQKSSKQRELYTSYQLDVKFPQGIQRQKYFPRNLYQSNAYLTRLCKSTLQNTAKSTPDESPQQIQVLLHLVVDTSGKVTSIEAEHQQQRDKNFEAILSQEINKRPPFLTYNENGVPATFNVTQPLSTSCQN